MKRILPFIVVLAMLLSSFSAFSHSKGTFDNGDVNRDGFVTIDDANLIQRQKIFLESFDSEQLRLADYNLDGSVNILDVTEIQMTLAKMKDSPVERAVTRSVGSNITVAFSNNLNWSKVYFYLFNSSTDSSERAWPGRQITNFSYNDGGEKVFTSSVNVDLYDRIIFTDGTSQTVNIPLNRASSGFYISDSSSSKSMLVGTYAYTGADTGTIKTLTLPYPSGYNKKIWVWTPSAYHKTGEKFRTVYIMDGQNLFDGDHQDSHGGWEVTDAVESMMSNGGRGVIIVGIDNGNSRRDSELTPDIGEVVPSYRSEFSNGTGIEFSDFVVNTVMPYVQKNYNSSRHPADNMIAGSSSGGLEAFYIGLENSDRFSMIGALSPAFLLFGDSVWSSYLSKFDFTSENTPKLYLYNGNGDFENNLYPSCISMYNRLKNLGYQRIKLSTEEKAAHNEAYWRIAFPESLSWNLLETD